MNPPTGVNAMVYDAADRLTLWPGMYSYTYFGDGSMKEVKNPAGTQVLRSYTYNDDGLLSGATYAGRSSTFTWDADKNRVGMTMNGDDYSFVYDKTAGIPAVIEEVTPDGSVFYIREPGGELLARVDGSDIRYYHFDELGSTRMLTDGSGTVTDRYVFDAWGNTLSHTGATDQPYQYVGRLGYYTHTQDPEFALMQLGVRFYDAEVGRFEQPDPAKYGLALYSYVNNYPLVKVDPSGLIPTSRGTYAECKKLLDDIEEAVRELQKRYKEMLFDKYGLYELYCEDSTLELVGIGSWTGHQQQYCDWQNRLASKHRQWDRKCKSTCLKLPAHGMCLETTGPIRRNLRDIIRGGKPCTPKKGRESPYAGGCSRTKP